MFKPKILAAPSRFIMGQDVIDEMGKYVATIGKRAFLVGGNTALAKTQSRIEKTLTDSGVAIVGVEKGIKMSTHNAVNRVVEIGKSVNPDIIIGVGGGVVADTAKPAAFKLGVPVVTVPTISSANADASSVAVIYTEEHEVQEYLFFPTNPALVIVDTKLIAQAPPRYIVAGMGDSLASKFEAEACIQAEAPSVITGGLSTLTALTLSRLCFDILMDYGLQAKIAAEKSLVTPAVENIIEAIKILSVFGFESAGLAAAHALHNGLTGLKKINKEHGEKVAFCTIAQMVMESRSYTEIEKVIKWCQELGLPTSLRELAELSDEEVMQAAKLACDPHDTMGNMPFTVTPEKAYNALQMADLLGKRIAAKTR